MTKPKAFKHTGSSIVLLIIGLFFLSACSSSKQRETESTASSSNEANAAMPEKEQVLLNEYAFAKLLGYIQFYHPSDEASELNWHSFSVSGAEKVQPAKNHEELKQLLEELYLRLRRLYSFLIRKQKMFQK